MENNMKMTAECDCGHRFEEHDWGAYKEGKACCLVLKERYGIKCTCEQFETKHIFNTSPKTASNKWDEIDEKYGIRFRDFIAAVEKAGLMTTGRAEQYILDLIFEMAYPTQRDYCERQLKERLEGIEDHV